MEKNQKPTVLKELNKEADKELNFLSVLEAPDIVTFILCKEILPHPFRRPSDNKVCFGYTEDISGYIDEFYRNIEIPILTFCKNLKLIRSMIFTLKSQGGGKK
jgi:hypothetical protein